MLSAKIKRNSLSGLTLFPSVKVKPFRGALVPYPAHGLGPVLPKSQVSNEFHDTVGFRWSWYAISARATLSQRRLSEGDI